MSTLSFDSVLNKFEEITETSANFLDFRLNGQISDEVKINIKEIHDFIKIEETHSHIGKSPHLFINNLDSEQIWQQIEIRNEKVLTTFINNISVLIAGADKLLFSDLKKKYEEKKDNSCLDNEDTSESDLQNLESNESNYITGDDFKKSSSNMAEPSSNECTNKRKTLVNSSFDDTFFKLTEMEFFLNTEERKLVDPAYGNQSDSNESEEEDGVNLFDDNFDANLYQENEAKTAKFKDYFVVKDENKKELKKNKLEELMKTHSENFKEDPKARLKTNLELKHERLKIDIDILEDQAVSVKPWQLKGEISAENRPHNSLLADVVGFDLISKPAPVITEQASIQLEDIIKQRLAHKLFDSVQRKNKPIGIVLEYKKELVLDQEKSKQSLAQIYEKHYFTQLNLENAGKEEQEPELHNKIKTLMTNVFTKLDALSNFYFTCKPTVPELKIVSHLPAINMEEVAPIAVSDTTLLAPEEIKNKPKGLIIGKDERPISYKKTERRKKKIKQRVINQLKLKKEKLKSASRDDKSNIYSKKIPNQNEN